MIHVVEGKTHVFGDNIDTDQIYPGRYLELTSKKDIAGHCMEGIKPGFINEIINGDILVVGKNFGCGSSREHAVITLKEAGIKAIVGESFGRIFYRNAINLGLAVIECEGINKNVDEGDFLRINLSKGEVENLTKKEKYYGNELPQFILDILLSNGIKSLFKTKYGNS